MRNGFFIKTYEIGGFERSGQFSWQFPVSQPKPSAAASIRVVASRLSHGFKAFGEPGGPYQGRGFESLVRGWERDHLWHPLQFDTLVVVVADKHEVSVNALFNYKSLKK